MENEEIPFINLDEDTSKFKKEQFCKEGDLVIADASEDYADIGKAIELVNVNIDLVAGLHTILARDKSNKTATGFKGYLFLTEDLRKKIKINANGISVLGISKNNIANLDVKLPSKQEQEKISSFLHAIDKKIELLEKKCEKFANMKRFYINEVFNFKNQVNKKSLGELCYIQTGKLDANAMVEDGKYRFYTCAKEYYKIDNYDFDTEALLISGNGAHVGYIHYYEGKFNAYQRTYVLDKFNQDIKIKYVKYFLEKNLHKQIWREKKEGNTPYIVLSTLKNMPIIYPNLEEQNLIIKVLDNMDTKLNLSYNQVAYIKNFKKGLMQKMFV